MALVDQNGSNSQRLDEANTRHQVGKNTPQSLGSREGCIEQLAVPSDTLSEPEEFFCGPGANWRKDAQPPAIDSSPPSQGLDDPLIGVSGGQIQCNANGPICANCGEMIIGRSIFALDKNYHHEHFVCTCCSQAFEENKFFIHEDEPYCEKDFFELFGNICKTCGNHIQDKCIEVEGDFYHVDHFICMECGCQLTDMKYILHEDSQKILCCRCNTKLTPKAKKSGRTCIKCLQLIEGGYILLGGQFVHPEHFSCTQCKCPLNTGNCNNFGDLLYCNEHYREMSKKTCNVCNLPIKGRVVNAMGRMWHPEHFRCFTCGELLTGNSFFEINGEPYCELHYSLKSGMVCSYCWLPIVGDNYTFGDKRYHTDHLRCTVCDTQLEKGTLSEWDSKPYCRKCYNKLPRELRKKYMQSRKAEGKLEKKKNKEK